MKQISTIIQIGTGLAFLFYGLAAFFSSKMKKEFDRYQAGQIRLLTGGFQILGALGLLLGTIGIGRFTEFALLASSGGLAIMMFVALGIRRKIRDPLRAKIPAFIFLVLNIVIFGSTL